MVRSPNIFTVFHAHKHTHAFPEVTDIIISVTEILEEPAAPFYGLSSPNHYQSTRRHILEDLNIYQHFCENLKSRTDELIPLFFVCGTVLC